MIGPTWRQHCQPRHHRYGSLDCIVVDGGDRPRIPVVLCHGFGAPGNDLASLSFEWLELLHHRAGEFRFIFPAAPIALDRQGIHGGRAWWPLNMARLLELAGASRFDELHDETPPGLSDARAALVQTIRQAFQDMPLRNPTDPWALGGFSQGAMLATDAALADDFQSAGLPTPDLLMLFSGTLVCKPTWKAAMPRLNRTHVFQSHGSYDPILPIDSAMRLHQLLSDAKIDTEFMSFDGPHTIHPESIARTAQRLDRLCVDKTGGS